MYPVSLSVSVFVARSFGNPGFLTTVKHLRVFFSNSLTGYIPYAAPISSKVLVTVRTDSLLSLPYIWQDQQNEVVRIVCQADAGGFVFSFRGVTSATIPFNASYGYLEKLLEDVDTITDVDVSVSGDGAVCGQDDEVVTTVAYLQEFGDLQAAMVR